MKLSEVSRSIAAAIADNAASATDAIETSRDWGGQLIDHGLGELHSFEFQDNRLLIVSDIGWYVMPASGR